jgi:hypothetical protein
MSIFQLHECSSSNRASTKQISKNAIITHIINQPSSHASHPHQITKSLLHPNPRKVPRLNNTPRLPLLLPTPILIKHHMPTLRLASTLRHATRQRTRVRRARVRGSLGGVGRAADFEVLAAGVVGLAVFGGAEGGWW